jgi:CheY-like chemotaxis protein
MTEDQGFVLVVDDEEDNREVLGRRLQRQGFRVAYAKGGKEALVAIGAQSFDVVLLDIMMPDVDGKSVLKIARRTYSSTQLPIIMATARHGGESVIESLELGANDYVTKPLDFPVVLARVRAAVGRKRAEDGMKRLRRQMEGILNAVPEAICSLDTAGLCTFCNVGLADLCGVEVEDLVGRPVHDVLHPGAACQAATCPLLEVLRDEQSHQGEARLWDRPVVWEAIPLRELDAVTGAVLILRLAGVPVPAKGERVASDRG